MNNKKLAFKRTMGLELWRVYMRIGKSALITAREFWVCAGSLSYRQNSICVVRPPGSQRDQFGGRRHIEMQRGVDSTSQLSDSARKQRVFEKVGKRMNDLEVIGGAGNLDFCGKLHPDVIVISDDTSLRFEPQNPHTTEWLRRRFGMENLGIRDRLRVHPLQCQKMVRLLKAAGF
jgi:hypothetical protein